MMNQIRLKAVGFVVWNLFSACSLSSQTLVSDSVQGWGEYHGAEAAGWVDGFFDDRNGNEVFEFAESVFTYYGCIGGDLRFHAPGKDEYPRLSRYAMAPDYERRAVKQWTSDFTGPATLVIDAQRLQSLGDGQRLVLRKNKEVIFETRLSNEDPVITRLLKTGLVAGDQLQLIVDNNGEGNRDGDWTAVRARVFRGFRDVEEGRQSVHLSFDQFNDGPKGWDPVFGNTRARVPDESGCGNHAVCLKGEHSALFQSGICGAAMAFDNYRTPLRLSGKKLGNESEELTISFWMAPYHCTWMNYQTIFSSSGRDFVTANLTDAGKENVLQFRVQPSGWEPDLSPEGEVLNLSYVDAPEGTTRFNRWTHVVLVWKSGQRQEIWLDGELAASSSNPVTARLSIDDWFIGKDHRPDEHLSVRIYNGLLDEFQLMPHALDHEGVQQRFQEAIAMAEGQLPAGEPDGLLRERWTLMESSTLDALKEEPKFFKEARRRELLASSHTDKYDAARSAERLRGYVVAPETGFYHFWVAAQGEVELSLSPSGSKYHKEIIASITREGGQQKGASPLTSRPFDSYDSQVSEAIYLEKGNRYFLEALQTSGVFRLNRFGLAWKTPSGDREFIPAEFLRPYYPEEEANDRDNDSLPDDWERENKLDPADNGLENILGDGEFGDLDRDGLNNRLEFVLGLDPANRDSDGDGYPDGEEYHVLGSDPALVDRPKGELIAGIDPKDYLSSDYDWVDVSGVLLSKYFRGGISWPFEVPESGPYFYDITLKLEGLRTSRVEVPFQVMVDGKVIAAQDVVFSGSNLRIWRVYGPPVAAGEHILTLVNGNNRIRRSIGILNVEVRQPEGTDKDEDGIPDWFAEHLYAGSGLLTRSGGSLFSPMFIEGTRLQSGEPVLVNGSPANSLGAKRWYADVALSPGENQVRVELPDGRVLNETLSWRLTNVLEDQALSARVGDSIMLGGMVEGQRVAALVSVNGSASTIVSPEESRRLTFESSGEYLVRSESGDGSHSAAVVINVMEYPLPDEIAVLTHWEREMEMASLPEGVVLSGAEDLFVHARNDARTGMSEVSLLASEGGDLALAARLGDDGPVLAVARVPAIVLSHALAQNSGQTYTNGAPEGYYRISAPFVALHLPEGARIELGLFRSGMLFTDGTIRKVLTPGDFEDGLTYVDFLFPKELFGGFCHHLSVFDRDGVQLNKR